MTKEEAVSFYSLEVLKKGARYETFFMHSLLESRMTRKVSNQEIRNVLIAEDLITQISSNKVKLTKLGREVKSYLSKNTHLDNPIIADIVREVETEPIKKSKQDNLSWVVKIISGLISIYNFVLKRFF
jgi:hypothetical protein